MKKKLLEELFRLPTINKSLIQWVANMFEGQESDLCAVTLTFKPSIKFHDTLRSKDIRHFLNCLNRRVFGRSSRKGASLKCIPVFEKNSSDGVHVHMILSKPHTTERLDKPFKDVVMSEWAKLEFSGVRKAQDIRDCYGVEGWVAYIMKEIKSGEMLGNLDVTNMHIAVRPKSV